MAVGVDIARNPDKVTGGDYASLQLFLRNTSSQTVEIELTATIDEHGTEVLDQLLTGESVKNIKVYVKTNSVQQLETRTIRVTAKTPQDNITETDSVSIEPETTADGELATRQITNTSLKNPPEVGFTEQQGSEFEFAGTHNIPYNYTEIDKFDNSKLVNKIMAHDSFGLLETISYILDRNTVFFSDKSALNSGPVVVNITKDPNKTPHKEHGMQAKEMNGNKFSFDELFPPDRVTHEFNKKYRAGNGVDLIHNKKKNEGIRAINADYGEGVRRMMLKSNVTSQTTLTVQGTPTRVSPGDKVEFTAETDREGDVTNDTNFIKQPDESTISDDNYSFLQSDFANVRVSNDASPGKFTIMGKYKSSRDTAEIEVVSSGLSIDTLFVTEKSSSNPTTSDAVNQMFVPEKATDLRIVAKDGNTQITNNLDSIGISTGNKKGLSISSDANTLSIDPQAFTLTGRTHQITITGKINGDTQTTQIVITTLEAIDADDSEIQPGASTSLSAIGSGIGSNTVDDRGVNLTDKTEFSIRSANGASGTITGNRLTTAKNSGEGDIEITGEYAQSTQNDETAEETVTVSKSATGGGGATDNDIVLYWDTPLTNDGTFSRGSEKLAYPMKDAVGKTNVALDVHAVRGDPGADEVTLEDTTQNPDTHTLEYKYDEVGNEAQPADSPSWMTEDTWYSPSGAPSSPITPAVKKPKVGEKLELRARHSVKDLDGPFRNRIEFIGPKIGTIDDSSVSVGDSTVTLEITIINNDYESDAYDNLAVAMYDNSVYQQVSLSKIMPPARSEGYASSRPFTVEFDTDTFDVPIDMTTAGEQKASFEIVSGSGSDQYTVDEKEDVTITVSDNIGLTMTDSVVEAGGSINGTISNGASKEVSPKYRADYGNLDGPGKLPASSQDPSVTFTADDSAGEKTATLTAETTDGATDTAEVDIKPSYAISMSIGSSVTEGETIDGAIGNESSSKAVSGIDYEATNGTLTGPSSLNPGEIDPVGVSFTADDSAGGKTATLTAETTDGVKSEKEINIETQQSDPNYNISLSVSGPVDAGETINGAIGNESSKDVSGIDYEATNGNGTVTGPSSLNPGEIDPVGVSFTADDSAGGATATLTAETTDGVTDTTDVEINSSDPPGNDPPSDPCDGVDCPGDKVCNGGDCECPSDMVECSDGSCAADQSGCDDIRTCQDDTDCGGCESCDNGACVDNDAKCDGDKVCNDGDCKCPSDMIVCADGSCAADSSGCDDIRV